MNSFLIISCLVGIGSARPDVSLGYRYPQPGSNQYLAPAIGRSYESINTGSFGSGSSLSSTHSFGVGGHMDHNHHQVPIVRKHFYIHSAPEEQQDAVHKHITIGQAQKNYRVVFIKAPEVNSAAAHISASYAPNEEKTVIYVLSKKPDEVRLDDIATPAPTEPSKPDVFFIKYKTPEEAAHAQHTIQAQYDSLGGSSKVSDEGIAPVSSVIGSLGGSAGGGVGVSLSAGSGFVSSGHHDVGIGSGSIVHNVGITGPSSAYLPGAH